ncbi:MAG: type II toxin-antitoxin system RelE/ParE family toxin [Emergencia sp.]|nr:type II toxin-antitoxin system RelE/ParE family toxin [Emergencia sp.]
MEQRNRYHVVVSEQATQMLVSHAAFLAQVSPEAAERLTTEFEKTANSLEIMPQRCPWLTGEYIPRNTYRFIMFEKRYMIIFQVMDDIIYADYVVDCRQDYGWLIR